MNRKLSFLCSPLFSQPPCLWPALGSYAGKGTEELSLTFLDTYLHQVEETETEE